jgi:nucleoside-diphosphate-sugar epimerase
MKVLVTGATGFIGQYVVNELLQRGDTVVASSANSGKAKKWKGEVHLTYIPFNLEDFDDSINYVAFFNQPDILIHLAWEGLPNYKSEFHVEVNLPRHLAFLTNMVRNGLHDITVTGTCFEYGMQEGLLHEEMDTKPTNPYGKAKDDLRKALENLSQRYPFTLKWVRLFYMYGKGQNPNSLLSQLDIALERKEEVFNMSGGQQVRDFSPVEAVAANIVRIALQKKVTGIINNCSAVPVTVQEFVEDYLKAKGKKIKLNLGHYPYPDYEPMRFWGDNKKLKSILENE